MRNYRDGLKGDANTAERFNHLLREQGILISPAKFYTSLVMDEQDLAHTNRALAFAANALRTEASA